MLGHPRVWERTGAAPHQLSANRGVQLGGLGGQSSCPGVSQQIRAPGRGAAAADPSAGTDGVEQLLWGHSWAGAKAWGAAKAEINEGATET